MGVFGGRGDDAVGDGAAGDDAVGDGAREPEPRRVVFHPEPLDDGSAGKGRRARGKGAAKAKAAGKGKGAAKTTGKGAGAAKSKGAGAGEPSAQEPETPKDRRAALQEQMAAIAKKYKKAPIEDMEEEIRKALAEHGKKVPDGWLRTIAESLREKGPTKIVYGEPDSGAW